jgi:protein-S-isoprenylcysteine O-methyltransferase Ste14
MEYISKLAILSSLILALVLGIQMILGKVRSGNLLSLKGFTLIKTIIIILLAPLLTLEVFFPYWLPKQLYFASAPEELYIGTNLLLFGLLIRLQAQYTLNAQWSADISLSNQPQLVTQGIYSWLRHPIYSSYCLIAPGLLLTTHNLAIGLLAGLYLSICFLRIPLEEAFLLRVFGRAYRDYCQKTPRLIFPRRPKR